MYKTNYITAPVQVTAEEHDFIQNSVMKDSFPWFWNDFQTYGSVPVKMASRAFDSSFFSHVLLRPSPSIHEEGTVNSTHFDLFNGIFQRWLEEQGIDCHRIYRAAVNLVEHVPKEMTVPHVDHLWAHHNWIMYLNTVKHSETVIFDGEYNIVAEVPCEQYQAVCFGGDLHAHRFPPPYQRRLAVVFTYSDAATV